MRLSSKDATVVPVMAVTSAIGHMAIGPLVNRTLHLPGPTLAGIVIMVPLLVAGALTVKKGMILATSILNGVVLSAFVPIGLLAIPVYAAVGATLELFCLRSFAVLFQPLYSFLAGGVANGVSVFLIATIVLGLRSLLIVSAAVALGFVTGALGGVIAAAVAGRTRSLR